jgi:hypothetical protein
MKRRMQFWILTIVCLTVLSSFTMHKFYVSITEIEYNQEAKSMEVSIKFIGHDLEHALSVAGVPDLQLGTDKEHKSTDDYLFKYISKHFSVLNDSSPIEFSFTGKEVGDDDFVYCYLKSETINSVQTLTFNNSLLVEVFEGQANIMYYKNGTEKYDYRFNKQKTSIKKQ